MGVTFAIQFENAALPPPFQMRLHGHIQAATKRAIGVILWGGHSFERRVRPRGIFPSSFADVIVVVGVEIIRD